MKEPLWLDERDALVLHDRLLSLHGAAAGLRDRALLDSALARPRQPYAYSSAPDIVDLAAIHTAALVRIRFHASEKATAQAVITLASGSLDDAGYAAFLRANSTREKRK